MNCQTKDTVYDKSALVWVMVWHQSVDTPLLEPCWLRSLMLNDVPISNVKWRPWATRDHSKLKLCHIARYIVGTMVKYKSHFKLIKKWNILISCPPWRAVGHLFLEYFRENWSRWMRLAWVDIVWIGSGCCSIGVAIIKIILSSAKSYQGFGATEM